MKQRPARNQGRLTPALVKETTLPRPGTPPSSDDLALARSVPCARRRGCRRSLDDTWDGATRHLTRSLRQTLFALARDRFGSAPDRAFLVRLSSDSSGEKPETRCHEREAPVHVSCETTTRVGARASSRMRATRVSCSTPCGAGSSCPLTCDEGSRRRDHDRAPRRKARSRAVTCCHDTDDAPVGSQRVEGSCERDERVQQGEPQLDLSRTPLVTPRMRTPSEHDVRRWPRGRAIAEADGARRPSRGAVDRRVRPSDTALGECSTVSVSRPAKDANLATIEMPSVHPDGETKRGSLPRHLVTGLGTCPRQAWDRGAEDRRLCDLVPRVLV